MSCFVVEPAATPITNNISSTSPSSSQTGFNLDYFFTNIHLFDGFYFDNLTMNFIFSFVFSFDEMENHNDANDIVLVNIDAKSRL